MAEPFGLNLAGYPLPRKKRSVGNYCAVYGCSNYAGKTINVSYHKFPRDPKLKKKWINRCRRADYWNPEKSFICSEHFAPDDFERDFKAELMQTRKRNILKPGSVPSKNLPKHSLPTGDVVAADDIPVKDTSQPSEEISSSSDKCCIVIELESDTEDERDYAEEKSRLNYESVYRVVLF